MQKALFCSSKFLVMYTANGAVVVRVNVDDTKFLDCFVFRACCYNPPFRLQNNNGKFDRH